MNFVNVISKRFYNEGAKVIIIDIDERAYLNNFSNKYREILWNPGLPTGTV